MSRFVSITVAVDRIDDHSPASWKVWLNEVACYVPKSQSKRLPFPNQITMPKWMYERMVLAGKQKAA